METPDLQGAYPRLSDTQVAALTALGERRAAQPEEVLFREGQRNGDFFVVEACEFDRSFHNLRPKIAVALNIEEDHLDCYSGIEEIVASFRTFARLVPSAVGAPSSSTSWATRRWRSWRRGSRA